MKYKKKTKTNLASYEHNGFEFWGYPDSIYMSTPNKTIYLTRAQAKKLIKFFERKLGLD